MCVGISIWSSIGELQTTRDLAMRTRISMRVLLSVCMIPHSIYVYVQLTSTQVYAKCILIFCVLVGNFNWMNLASVTYSFLSVLSVWWTFANTFYWNTWVSCSHMARLTRKNNQNIHKSLCIFENTTSLNFKTKTSFYSLQIELRIFR